MRTISTLALPLLVLGTAVAQSPLVYSNGPLITEVHASIPASNSSRLQSGAPPAGLNMNVLGFGAQQAAGNALADDFSVLGAMVIDGIEVFGYATSAPTTPSPVTGVYVEISSTDPAVAITPVVNSPGLANNQLANTTHGFSNIYRVTTTTLTATNRAIMSMRVNLANPIILTQGTYWLVFQYTGVNFCPPVSVMGSNRMTTTANTARQRVGAAGVFNPLFDTGNPVQTPPLETTMAFNLYGSSPAQLGSITMTNTGCGATTIAVNGNAVPGGFVQATMTLSGGGLGLVGFGFINVTTPFCGCNFGHEWSVVLVGSAARVDIPQDPTFVGLGLMVQGAELGGIGGCANPQLTATDTYKYQL